MKPEFSSILVAFLVLICAALITQAATPLAQYHFNGSYADVTGNGYDATSVGTWESLGDGNPLGDLLHTDADRGGVYRYSSVELQYDDENGGDPHNNRLNIVATQAFPSLPAGEGVTYSLWVKREADHASTSSAHDFAFMLYLGAYGDNPIFSLALGLEGRINAYFEGDGEQVFMEGTTAIPADEWTHLILVIDRAGNEARAYINGTEDALIYRAGNSAGAVLADLSSAGGGELDWQGGSIGNNAASDNAFVGSLNDVRIYYEALELAEVTDLAVDYPLVADFSAFGVDRWPSYGFGDAAWEVSEDGLALEETTPESLSIAYATQSIAGKVITGVLTPGEDTDAIGIVLGYEPGEATRTDGEFLLLDWKGESETYDFGNPGVTPLGDPFHQRTPGGTMRAGLALSRVTGYATADELWQHASLGENPEGGVMELARATTLGDVAYDEAGHAFEIHYSATEIIVYVDGVEEIRVQGTFPTSGSYGLYDLAQGSGFTATRFAVQRTDTDVRGVDFSPLELTPNPPAEPSTENPYGLTAYVFERQDAFTQRTGAAELLRRAGFHVQELPLDQPPFLFSDDPETDVDLIFFGSFLAGIPEYDAYMDAYASILDDYIDRAGMLVHMSQSAAAESNPPFLPDTQDASRVSSTYAEGFVITPSNALVQGIPVTAQPSAPDIMSYRFNTLDAYAESFGWNAFEFFSGFEVILAGGTRGRSPIMMEGAYGQGRFLMTAMAFDKFITESSEDASSPSQRTFNEAFFANLYEHTRDVRDRTVPPIAPTPPPGATNLEPGAWTLAILPDTQIYSQNYPGMFFAQMGWVRDNVRKNNIRYVLHLGDIVNVNSIPEWQNAAAAFGIIHDVVPYAFVPGNHDYGTGGTAATRQTYMNDYLRYRNYLDWPSFGEAMIPGEMDNSYHFFEAWGHRFIIICLEWGPRDSTIAWARSVLDHYPDHYAILLTHAYLNNNDLRYDHTDTVNPQLYNPHHYRTTGGVNDGEELWQKLVNDYNFVLTLNGHVLGDGTGYRVDTNQLGNEVHQILVNYQMRQLGGQAYLRLLEFQPDGRTVIARSYSPVYNSFLLEADQEFSFVMDLGQEDTDGDSVLDYHDPDFDWDGDGIDNQTEFELMGTSNWRTDTDGDGLSDATERVAGTNPTTAETDILNFVRNNPRLLDLYDENSVSDLFLGRPTIRLEGGNLRITLQLEFATDLNGSEWVSEGESVEWVTPMEGSAQFFRIRTD